MNPSSQAAVGMNPSSQAAVGMTPSSHAAAGMTPSSHAAQRPFARKAQTHAESSKTSLGNDAKECEIKTFQDTCSGGVFVTSVVGQVQAWQGTFYLANLLQAACGSDPASRSSEKLLGEGRDGLFRIQAPLGFSSVEVYVNRLTRWVQRLTFHRNGNLPSVSVGSMVGEDLVLVTPLVRQGPRQAVRVLSKHEDCADGKLFLVAVEVFYEDERKNVVTEQGIIINATRKPLTRQLPNAPPKPLQPPLLPKRKPAPPAPATPKTQKKNLAGASSHGPAPPPHAPLTAPVTLPPMPKPSPAVVAPRGLTKEWSRGATWLAAGLGAGIVVLVVVLLWRAKKARASPGFTSDPVRSPSTTATPEDRVALAKEQLKKVRGGS